MVKKHLLFTLVCHSKEHKADMLDSIHQCRDAGGLNVVIAHMSGADLG